MNLNDLIREAQEIANKYPTGDIPLKKNIHLILFPEKGYIDIKIKEQ